MKKKSRERGNKNECLMIIKHMAHQENVKVLNMGQA